MDRDDTGSPGDESFVRRRRLPLRLVPLRLVVRLEEVEDKVKKVQMTDFSWRGVFR